ncbi:adenylyl-sulfate kinase [Flagellimonas hymeniacidonis]|uniref:Adenylyl-sulfate kinase n=1 Tax=Flagellimonas hymeniacidonis TaxID=2603628 RepID=A0A5C8V3S7_9FLAO|nr:adenylyl-sulfate kinase [Flagellimonas hymeniacidonis]TXN35991.1 adenylyl-sulfate kinase [Flagellimonas hymeniacidonis]
MEKNITEHRYKVDVRQRRQLNSHNSFLVFFTGLSGSGKSTLANALEQQLFGMGIRTYVLDGDNIRKGINKGLSFSPDDRSENNRRIGEISKLFVDAGVVVLAAFVAPYNRDRMFIRETVGFENYVEVFVDTTLEECERRDVKGLYKMAREGKISDLTGVSAPYETPVNPDVTISNESTVHESTNLILSIISKKLQLR